MSPSYADSARKTILSHRLKRYVDLNTDLGQTRDQAYFAREDHPLLNHVSSVNIPCGVHDGDPVAILAAIEQAKRYNCAVGAHIGYPDPAHYGYEPLPMPVEEVQAWTLLQLGAFRALVESKARAVEHVRPHGALYLKLMTDLDFARRLAETIYRFDPWVILVGPAGPVLDQVHADVGIRIAPEIVLGKRYNAQGQLVLQRMNDTLPMQGVLDQARQLFADSSITAQDGKVVKVQYSTLHLSPKLDQAGLIAEKLTLFLGQSVPLSVAAVGPSGWV